MKVNVEQAFAQELLMSESSPFINYSEVWVDLDASLISILFHY